VDEGSTGQEGLLDRPHALEPRMLEEDLPIPNSSPNAQKAVLALEPNNFTLRRTQVSLY